MASPKFKSIKIKLDKDHTYSINDKGTLTISTMKMDKRDVNIDKLNSTIDSIIEPPKRRGPRPGSKRTPKIAPIELIENHESEIEQPIPVKRGRGRPKRNLST